ncbi:hypothetical protein POM88_017528 [Heracleum sosnowskyi]|uniref:Transposase MuDR plant domain-containing protein n=1 Tax=Heracleum sosnowskyi TaxID=360622 RepID=A0AAD8ISP0_9APIA|nr:hypothetical protein POM88_017528 [Heracleum sosnowskyi]
MFENYIRTDLGYKQFKIYWLSGSLVNESNCKLLWNDDSLEQMIAYALMSDRIYVYVDHGCEIEDGEGSDDSEKEDDSFEDSDLDSEKEDGSEEDSGDDSKDEDYNCNLSDCDDEWAEVMQKKKRIQPTEKKGKGKKKWIIEEDGKGFEIEYDSDSFKIVGEEISDSSDDNIADSVGTKKKERETWFKKNDLQMLQAKCRQNCLWYLFASKMDETCAFQVKTYNKDHNCILVHKHKLMTSDWLARKIGSKVRANPKWKLREIQHHVLHKSV